MRITVHFDARDLLPRSPIPEDLEIHTTPCFFLQALEVFYANSFREWDMTTEFLQDGTAFECHPVGDSADL